jgi:hypothetical protein
MTQEALRWKLFPFSLKGKAKQWYMFAIESMNGDWDELKDKFCLAFFPMSRIGSLPRVILDFEQHEKESIGAAWARFSMLLHAIPNFSLPDGVILHLFCTGLDIDADLCLDMIAGGRFTHKTMMEQVEFLEHFITIQTSSVIRTEPLQPKVMSSDAIDDDTSCTLDDDDDSCSGYGSDVSSSSPTSHCFMSYGDTKVSFGNVVVDCDDPNFELVCRLTKALRN